MLVHSAAEHWISYFKFLLDVHHEKENPFMPKDFSSDKWEGVVQKKQQYFDMRRTLFSWWSPQTMNDPDTVFI